MLFNKAKNALEVNFFPPPQKKKILDRMLIRYCSINSLMTNKPIKFPVTFVEYYEDEIEGCVEQMEGIEYDDNTLCIKYGVVETKLFQPTIDGIVQCTVKN